MKKLICETRNEKDKMLESMWCELEDVPFDFDEDGRMIMSTDWWIFKRGTDTREIWVHFNTEHSMGVKYLIDNFY